MPILNKEQAKKYVRNGGSYCPFCNGINIVDTNTFYLTDYLARIIKCYDCKKMWREYYKLVGIMYEELIDNKWEEGKFIFK